MCVVVALIATDKKKNKIKMEFQADPRLVLRDPRAARCSLCAHIADFISHSWANREGESLVLLWDGLNPFGFPGFWGYLGFLHHISRARHARGWRRPQRAPGGRGALQQRPEERGLREKQGRKG